MYRIVTQTVDNHIQASAVASTFALTDRYADNLFVTVFVSLNRKRDSLLLLSPTETDDPVICGPVRNSWANFKSRPARRLIGRLRQSLDLIEQGLW